MELITQKDYTLLSEASYFDARGELKKTKQVILYALKLSDADEVIDLLRFNKISKTLEFLAKKGYIVPAEGKLKLDDLHFIAATALFKEYEESFLDALPFLPTKEKGKDSENQYSVS